MNAAPALTLDPQWVEAELAAEEAGREERSHTRRGLLDRISQRRADVRAAEADELVAITEWADLHRTDAAHDLLHVAAGMLPAPIRGSWDTCPIDMSGIPVDEYALAELATTLEVADGTARTLVEDALELRERLPRTWARILALKAPVWKARLLARRTLDLSPEAADYVDRHLAQHLHKLSKGRIKAGVNAAILRFDPERAATEAAQAGDNRGVWFDLEHGSALANDPRPDGTGRFGGRSEAEIAATGIPMSRPGATAAFTKLEANLSYDAPLEWGFQGHSVLRGQKAIRGVMPSAEIFSMDGEDGLSALTAGGLSDDGGWVLRQEVARPWQLPGAVGVLPYGYWAAARPSTRLPGGTAQSHATSWGFGLRAGWRNASLAAEWGRASITPGSRRTSQAFFKAQVQF